MATPLRPHEGLSPDQPTPIDTTPLPPAKIGYGPGDVTTEEIYNELGRPSGWFPFMPSDVGDAQVHVWGIPKKELPIDQSAWLRYSKLYGWSDNAPYAVVPYWRRAQRVFAPGVQFRKSRYSRRRYRRYRLRWRS